LIYTNTFCYALAQILCRSNVNVVRLTHKFNCSLTSFSEKEPVMLVGVSISMTHGDIYHANVWIGRYS